ncbi:BglG family transcription antiterminator [Hafnia alvei]|uniref:BglG family transcription antiterminator n=1 Tax=Hafnia alvei TaxID=569 RepID=UPI0040458892
MISFPYPRLNQVFDALLEETLPQEELARRFAVSTRTVRTDVTALNDILSQYGAEFVHLRGSGYRLDVHDADRFSLLQQQSRATRSVPRSAKDRVTHLLLRFLAQGEPIKLDDVADSWFVSRASLQSDMADVRDMVGKYGLTIESKPHYGMKLFGRENAVRACLANLLFQYPAGDPLFGELRGKVLPEIDIAQLREQLHLTMQQYHIRLTDEAEQQLLIYCGIILHRIRTGFLLDELDVSDVEPVFTQAARDVARYLEERFGCGIPETEVAYLSVQIAARRITDASSLQNIDGDENHALVSHILSFINEHYNYDLRDDEQLSSDLLSHIATMMTRAKYQINIPNPLLEHIKQHYPLAYDVTLAAVSSWGKNMPYTITDNEIGYLVLHIGVGLERHYDIGYERHPQALLVCDSGMSTLRLLETKLKREFPQLIVNQVDSLREYEKLEHIEEDFVISMAKVPEKNKPVVTVAPFPTSFQLEQLAKLVLVDRTKPYMLEKFFDATHFCVLNEPVSQADLFARICHQIQQEGYVDADFHPSLIERESIVSTMLGEGIALPHSLGLLAKKTVIYTVLAPQGVRWGENETAHVIFLLAISKQDYEEAMAIYDLFVTFMRERAVGRLLASTDFEQFRDIAMDCLSRS